MFSLLITECAHDLSPEPKPSCLKFHPPKNSIFSGTTRQTLRINPKVNARFSQPCLPQMAKKVIRKQRISWCALTLDAFHQQFSGQRRPVCPNWRNNGGIGPPSVSLHVEFPVFPTKIATISPQLIGQLDVGKRCVASGIHPFGQCDIGQKPSGRAETRI